MYRSHTQTQVANLGQPVDVIDANRPPHTNPVHLVDENLGEEVCKLPKGTRYRVPPSHTVKELLPIARDYSGRVDRIAITPDDEVVLLPKGTIAQVIGNRIWLPAEVTGIRYIDKTDQDIVEKWCEQTYRQQEGIPLEPGWKYEPKDSYVRRCIDINLWNVGHRFEPVAVGKRYTRRI
ncbi:hypothetical protein APHAL10511_005490 [Amanita phalloides]|nr:hypothetical protein APHAL10511_005490 [Amanita phalloides]